MNLIPAIDLINGCCVRLTQGNYQQMTIYTDSPLTMAQSFEDWGLRHLHLVDLEGARAQRIIHQQVLKLIADNTSLQIDYSGGLRTDQDIDMAFESGAHKVVIGSMAVTAPEQVCSWLKQYGSERIIIGADVNKGMVMTKGWQENSGISIEELLERYIAKGVKDVMCTDTQKDGLLQGPATELYTTLLQQYPISLIASGGVSGMEDLLQLRAAGCSGAIVGKALYEGRISPDDLHSFIQSA